ncbi:MAG: hypothetical protein DSY90_04110 [Deltaproteobacteria bacterium]|nr:MAG: hypothetical protein DSY90_04110 [Deltaproteobacteria bacterium]
MGSDAGPFFFLKFSNKFLIIFSCGLTGLNLSLTRITVSNITNERFNCMKNYISSKILTTL